MARGDDGWPRADNKVGVRLDGMRGLGDGHGASVVRESALSLPDDDAGPPAAVRSDGVR